MSETHELSIYDLTRWKPITPAHYLDELGSCFLTGDDPVTVTTVCESLPGGVFRLVTSAHLVKCEVDHEGTEGVQPYLMVLFYPEGMEGRPNLCFKRTDLELWLA